MKPTDPILAIGMMSGTSVDGAVDTAAIITDGDGFVERRLVTDHRYEAIDGLRPVHHCTKAAEIAYRRAKGDYKEAVKEYLEALRLYVQETFKLTAPADIDDKIASLGAGFHGVPNRPVTLNDVIDRSTQVHAEAIEKTLAELGADAAQVALIGYHGQTLYHAPFDHITVQVGDAQALADRVGTPVVFDFRSNDVAQGGQGAPLAPAYHRALLRKAGLPSAAVLNLGGTANITVVTQQRDEIIGFDTGPANGLIDKYVKEKAGLGMDVGSALALKGQVSEAALQVLRERAIILGDGRNYLDIAPPKSLDIRDYNFDFPEFMALSLEDGCATLNAFTADCIAAGLQHVEQAGFDIPNHWILCGGGAQSPNLRRELQERLSAKIGHPITLVKAEDAGWSAQGMEAELFAFLAMRSLNNLPLTFPLTTGVAQPLTGGQIYQPQGSPTPKFRPKTAFQP